MSNTVETCYIFKNILIKFGKIDKIEIQLEIISEKDHRKRMNKYWDQIKRLTAIGNKMSWPLDGRNEIRRKLLF